MDKKEDIVKKMIAENEEIEKKELFWYINETYPSVILHCAYEDATSYDGFDIKSKNLEGA